jgi:hypothetical protein
MAEMTAWIFSICLISATADRVICEDSERIYWSYAACTDAQLQYNADHEGENYITFCKREDKPKVKT